MRTKQYIANVAETMVGHSLMKGLVSDANSFRTSRDLRSILQCVLEPKLKTMTAEKLGVIIEYSDLSFLRANSTIIHREPAFYRNNPAEAAEIAYRCAYGGKVLLEHLALLTILAIVFDIIKQGDYEQEEWEADRIAQRQYDFDVSTGIYDDNDGERR